MRRPHHPQCEGEDWQRARMRCLVRDNFRCQAHRLGLEPCEEERLRFLVVHHIKARINGGTHDLDNLVTLCRRHHADIHPHLRFELEAANRELGDYPWREL